MESPEQAARPVLSSLEDLARLIDYPLLGATLTEEEVDAGCRRARQLRIGLVTVRPADVTLAAKWMQGSGIDVGSAVSFPSGDETTATKVYATRDLLQRGARNIETVLNLGKILSRQFQYVELELLQMAQECHRAGATLTLDLEWPLLAADHRVIACKIAKRVEADTVRTSSIHSGPACGAKELAFLRQRLGEVRLDAGPVETWEQVTAAYEAGAERVAAENPGVLLESWQAELERRKGETPGV